VKEFLRQQNIAFTDRDITSDESALGELEKLGVMTTPVTVVDGQLVMVGSTAQTWWHENGPLSS
jgi:glutaredoxin